MGPMEPKILKTEKITNSRWFNLFKRIYFDRLGKKREWIFASRKKDPDKPSIDVAVVIPVIKTGEYESCVGTVSEKKLVLIKQFRIPIGDYIYELPAGLTEGKSVRETAMQELWEETGLTVSKYLGESGVVYSSPGSTDESTVMVFVEAVGELTNKNQEDGEDIEVIALSRKEASELLLDKDKIIGAKAWGILLAFAKGGVEGIKI